MMNRSDRKVTVYRMGHRPERDKRISTHVALAARAFGACGIIIDNRDDRLEKTVDRVTVQFGGDFRIDTGIPLRKVLSGSNGTVVHLTMYGMDLEQGISEIPPAEDLLVIVGSQKVPREVYDEAHLNISVSNQPHSEVSALALFLDRLFRGDQLKRSFTGGEVRITPSNTGKAVLDAGCEQDGKALSLYEIPWSAVPDEKECMELLRAAGCSTRVLAHSKAVHELGMELYGASVSAGGGGRDLDPDILSAGLLLHDLGRSRTHSIRHVDIGSDMAIRLGLDFRIAEIIHDHAGAGITADESLELGLRGEDHLPKDRVEKLVSHSDSLVRGSRRRTLKDAEKMLRSAGAENGADRLVLLHSELEDFLGIDIDAFL